MAGLFGMMAKQVHGSIATKYDQMYPGLDADGSVHFAEYDGEVVGPIAVRGVSWIRARMSLNGFNLRVNQETDWRYFDVSLYLTDARLVVVVDKPIDARTRRVGHLRYPWIHSVGYRPRQSFLNECELVVGMEQPEGGAEMPIDCTLRFLLNRTDDSAELARQIVRRLAGHHLARGTLPPTAIPGFEQLLDPPHLPDPKKGDHATYWFGAYKHYPAGAEYIFGEPEAGTWRGTDT
ncbi:hypothetical protein OG474_41645 [Kribbella sp. NBC_01505]|uniref:hypothetical protein n=1 Tax=Kribbella sp. NBC_01505 TaxID=2903580 RepID=UPI003869D856